MRKAFFLAISLASMIFAQGALAADYGTAHSTPVSSMVMVSFPDSSTTFQPPADVAAVLADARAASMIYVNGRTSTNRPSSAAKSATFCKSPICSAAPSGTISNTPTGCGSKSRTPRKFRPIWNG